MGTEFLLGSSALVPWLQWSTQHKGCFGRGKMKEDPLYLDD